jgi:hypothetical protein
MRQRREQCIVAHPRFVKLRGEKGPDGHWRAVRLSARRRKSVDSGGARH